MKTEKENVSIILASIEKESKPLTRKVSDLEITDQESFEVAGSIIKQLKDKVKLAKLKEGEITDPIKQALTKVQELFKPFYASVALIENTTKERMLAYKDAQDKKQTLLDEKVESGKLKLGTYAKKSEELSTKNAFSSTRKVKTLVITASHLIPREYLVPDEAAIKASLLAGKKVAGCKIELKNSIAI